MTARPCLSAFRKGIRLAACLLTVVIAGDSRAMAQGLPVPGLSAPAFPPQPPSQQLQVPSTPQFGVASPLNVSPPSQNSFSDRATRCLQTGAAAGLTTGSLNAYTGECVTQ